MNRYAVLAIFVVIMVVALGSMHAHLMDLKKAKMEKEIKSKIRKEKVVKKVEEVPVKKELSPQNYFKQEYEFYNDDEPADTPTVSRREPEIQQEQQESISNVEHKKPLEPQKREPIVKEKAHEKQVKKESKLEQLFGKKKDEEKSDKPVDSGAGNVYGCKKLFDGNVEIPCHQEFDGLGFCYETTFIVSENDFVSENLRNYIVESKDFREVKGANEEGDKVTWGLANSLCVDADFYLPNKEQLRMISLTQNTGCGVPVHQDFYWGDVIDGKIVSYCNMATGECHHLDMAKSEVQKTMFRVRCVKY